MLVTLGLLADMEGLTSDADRTLDRHHGRSGSPQEVKEEESKHQTEQNVWSDVLALVHDGLQLKVIVGLKEGKGKKRERGRGERVKSAND